MVVGGVWGEEGEAEEGVGLMGWLGVLAGEGGGEDIVW